MKNAKYYHIGIFVIVCILLNYALKSLAIEMTLPLWLDNIGTAFTAYELGPFCGAVVGATVNIMYGLGDHVLLLYAFVSAYVGIIIGLFAEKKMFDSMFHVISIGLCLSVVSTVISTPINWIFYDGYTTNVWGDGIYNLLQEWNVHRLFAATVSEFFLDFLDKIVTVLVLAMVLYLCKKAKKLIRLRKFKANKIVSLIVVCLMAVSLLPVNAFAKDDKDEEEDYNSYIQFTYSNNNGLLSGEANDIVTTKDGVLWVGTYAGLYRYNGVRFQYMNEYESVKNVNCLYCDEEGRLMIGTNDCGLSIAINGEIVNVIDEDAGLPSNSVRCIVQESSGKYFVGTSDMLAIVTLSGGIAVYDTVPEIIYAYSICADDNDHVATVTNSGDLFLLNDTEIVAKMPGNEDYYYTACSFDEEGKLYVGTSEGEVFIYDVSKDKLLQEKEIDCKSTGSVSSIDIIEKNNIIVCGDMGACQMNGSYVCTAINLGDFNSSLTRSLVDYQGNLWFASSRLGILKLCKSPFSELYAEVGLQNQVTNAITVWNNSIYVGTDAGLQIINKRGTAQIKSLITEMLEGVRVRCVIKDSKNNLWISTYGHGVIKMESSSEIKVFDSKNGLPGNRFRFTYELKDGSIAVSGDEGIAIISNDEVVDIIDSSKGLNNNVVLSMYENDKGELLVGTDGGGINVIKNGRVSDWLKKNDGLGSDVILRLVKDKNGNGVFVVTSNCISYIDYDQDAIRVLDKFPYTNNYDIYDNGEGKLFVTGSAGVYVVEKDSLLSGREPEYELLNSLNGLRGSLTANAWNYVDQDNIFYIANGNGVSRLDLNQYQEKIRSYRMLLNSYKIDDEEYKHNANEEIRIPSGAGKVELSPEIINYSTKDPYISYYLEGIDEEPIILRQSELSTIIYANIPAGNYNFYLSVLDDSMSRNIEQQVYRVVKEKQIYENWWFKLFFVIELFLIIACITWFITRTVVQKTINIQRKEIELARNQIQMGNETILAIAKTVDAKHPDTSQHSTRVSEYSVLISQKLGYSEEDQENLRKMALLHDIGKIGIPDDVLKKNGPLSDAQYETMKSHVTIGGEILKDFTLVKNVQNAAMYHHEKWDGTGYAKGLKGEEIPEEARIVGIADAFDAMTANRVYRKKLDFEYVLGELKRCRGTQFDPKMVDIMLELIEEGKIDVKSIYGEE